MTDELYKFSEKPSANYLIAGWRRQWSDGGRVSGGLTRYLVEKLDAKRIGELGTTVSNDCYPFQVAGTHDTFRPLAAYQDGLPVKAMYRENYFYDAGNGLIIFRGEEPWFHIEIFGQAFFEAAKELGIKQIAAVEGVNGPVPPDMERRVTCVYSKAEMREELDRYGLQFSSYGSEGRRGPTIAMALVSLAHFEYPDVEMFRLGAMAPMFPFSTSGNDQVGITRDHRSYYDIMRRLRSMFKLDLDLSELLQLGEDECRQLEETLEKISSSNREAKQLIDSVKSDYSFTPYVEPVDLDPVLDQTLEDILRNMPE
ncbi:MAG: PAC2 family protein [Chloroflexi bacterium]|nr:PAC2 family protein [Chloroflexota bacterium]MCH8349889.1 PAC2 family protein [Chloroflexota bacterium]MCI0781129.1 PAC2 family protein [Chloroflexota bacterium]MCI0786204.1 PAC2 family protein [Chloroflexota bacterium]MCI0794016.1 PAC2 family protein [Chloroflexota bacterium]